MNPRTRDEILADWHALNNNESTAERFAQRVRLLEEAVHLNPAPREMWCWVIGAFGSLAAGYIEGTG